MKKVENMPLTNVKIGLKRGRQIAQMENIKRLKFIAEGLPRILASSKGYWEAKVKLEKFPREADVLEGLAKEEAAKVLILMDIVRCPANLLGEMTGKLMRWFYDHRSRLIYANAAHWCAPSLIQLREYIEPELKSHYLEGDYNEYILPNRIDYNRENKLYVDIEQHYDGTLNWSAPFSFKMDFGWSFPPASLNQAEAMDTLGLFTERGIMAVSEIWGQVNFKDSETRQDADALTEELIKRIESERLFKNNIEKSHYDSLYEWQIPMYNLDLTKDDCLNKLQNYQMINK
jgi:hypothetical protein